MEVELINVNRFNKLFEGQQLQRDKDYYISELILKAYHGNRRYKLGNDYIYFDYDFNHDQENDIEQITIKFK